MPLEIREVVIQAKLEKSDSSAKKSKELDKYLIEQIKKEILAECMEQLEDKLARRFER